MFEQRNVVSSRRLAAANPMWDASAARVRLRNSAALTNRESESISGSMLNALEGCFYLRGRCLLPIGRGAALPRRVAASDRSREMSASAMPRHCGKDFCAASRKLSPSMVFSEL